MTQTVIIERSKGKKLKKNYIDGSSVMMSKPQKFAKGYSSSFVSDYRHAEETVGDSDVFGSSGRADSEHSCTPKRRCISLNVDQNNDFNVPFQVFSTSKMSGPEKKEVEMRLRAELDKVQIFQKGILSCTPAVGNGLTVSSSNDRLVMGQSLKRGTSASGRFESTKQCLPLPPSGRPDAMVMKQCETILRTLMTHKYGWVFKSPVDVVALKIPDYLTIIKHPMDLGTVKKKLASRSYYDPLGFASDVRLTFTNAMTYNPPGNDVHIMADTLTKIFEKRWGPLGEKLAVTEVRREAEVTNPKSPEKKRKIPPVDHRDIVRKCVRPKITYSEKQNLRDCLISYDDRLPDHVIEFLRKESNNNKASSEEIDVDFETLSDDAIFQLKKLLDDCPNSKGLEAMAKAEPCEMEVLVESGLSNSSPPCKGNDPIEEEVDIVGDDPPVSSYPPVEIEKDTTPRSSQCSSSSSDSGSSSSDSDSDSSSGSESDVHVATPAKSVKDNGQSGTTMEQGYPIDANKNIINALEHQEHHARPKPASVESDAHHEGENTMSKRQVSENATSKRQISHDKNYRAALLRSRFADTILKAREKTLNQNEKKDPEKLRREREELEKQQREEKARLQAEARAAEIGRRQAEAAEAKRERELERERARQALLQMEKTVEIYENNLFIKDLEMLRTAPVEDISCGVHGMSSDPLEEGMGGFKLGGSNPLEQLGLFMKDDDDEEDEDEGRPSSGQTNDVEEGEID